MLRDPQKYLFDMADSCRFLRQFTSSHTLEDLRNDRGFRSAVEREMQIIGEAMMVLSKLAPAVAEVITEHARIVRLRHVLVHGYDKLDHDILWNILENKLTILQADVERLLAELDETS